MGVWRSLFGKEQNKIINASISPQYSTPLCDPYVINNANSFASLCYKIGQSGGKGKGCAFPVCYQLRTTSTGLIEVYATHTVHDDDLLEFAYDKAAKNDRVGVEWTYNEMIDNYNLAASELRSFSDVSDFMEFLRGGISGFNSCKRSGHDIEITQELGCVQPHEKNYILPEIKKTILNSHSYAREENYYGSTLLVIRF